MPYKKYSISPVGRRQLLKSLSQNRQLKLLEKLFDAGMISPMKRETVLEAIKAGKTHPFFSISGRAAKLSDGRVVVGKSYGVQSFNNRPVERASQPQAKSL